MGNRRPAYLTGQALANLLDLAANATSEAVRLGAAKTLFSSPPVVERLVAMTQVAQRKRASQSQSDEAAVEQQLLAAIDRGELDRDELLKALEGVEAGDVKPNGVITERA